MHQLAKHQKQRNLVSIRRGEIDGCSIQGFVLGLSENLVLLQYVYDFHLDGLMLLRTADITEVRHTKTAQLQKKLLKQEGLLERVPLEITLDLSDWKSAISQLSAEHGLMIIECEAQDEPDFFIGRVTKTTKLGVQGHYFSGAANWEDEPSKLKFKDITCCQVATNYINFYKRYFERVAL